MKRKTSKAPSRGWQFGCWRGPDREDLALVERQFELGHRYFNRCIEIKKRAVERYQQEREHVALQLESILPVLTREYEIAKAEREKLYEQVKLQRKLTRKRVKPNDLDAARLKHLRERMRGLALAIKEERTRVDDSEAMLAARETLNQARYDELKAARHAITAEGLYWPNYLLVDDAMKTATEFARWTGDNSIQAHIMGGMTTAQLYAGSNMVWLERLPDDFSRRDRHRGKRARLHLRIGTDAAREPVWAHFQVILHRPLPLDARIKNIVVRRERVGGIVAHHEYDGLVLPKGATPKYRWTMVVKLEAHSFEAPARLPTATCALNLGFRELPSGALRVAYLTDTQGRSESIELPTGSLRRPKNPRDRLLKVRELHEIRSRAFNEAMRALLKYASTETGMAHTPKWFDEAAAHMHAWKSHWRLQTFVARWRQHRFPHDEDIMGLDVTRHPEADRRFVGLIAWAVQDAHLTQWIDDQTTRTLGYRRELYRILAKRLATQYSEVVLHGYDLRQTKESKLEAPARWNKRVAGLSFLRSALANACANSGSKFVTRPEEERITMVCHACGGACDFNRGHSLEHRCEHCGARWDQDFNAARNVLLFQLAEAG